MIWSLFAALFGWFFAWIINKTIYSTSNPSRTIYWSWIIGTFIVLFIPVFVLTGLIYKSTNMGILFTPFMIAFYLSLKNPSTKVLTDTSSSVLPSEPKVVDVYPVNSPKTMPSRTNAAASNLKQPSPPSYPLKANFAASATTTSTTAPDDLWAKALTEYESSSRNQGLWARLFSEAQGNETLIKANYLRVRVDEMQQLITAENERVAADLASEQLEIRRIAEAARQAELQLAMTVEQREYDALPKGLCPNCKGAVLPLTVSTCPKCWTLLGPESPRKATIKPLSKSEQITALRRIAAGGNKLTEYEVQLLERG